MSAVSGTPVPTGTRTSRPRWWRLLVAGVVLLVAVEYGLLPALVAARHDIRMLAGASVPLLLLAFALEAASLVSWTGMTRSVLPRRELKGWPTHLAVDVAGYGASHVLPGGGATAAAVRYRLMTSVGVSSRATVTCMAVQPTLGGLALAGCYLVGVVVSLQEVRHHPVLVLTAILGTAAIALTTVASVSLSRRETSPGRHLRAWRGRWERAVARTLHQMTDDVQQLLRDDTRTVSSVVFAVANWLLDAACLWCCLAAYSERMPPGDLLVVYGFANIVGLLPLTPGGLGLVEGTLIPLTIAFGAAPAAAVLGVLTWRVMQFWLPVPVGLASYGFLAVTGRLEPASTSVE